MSYLRPFELQPKNLRMSAQDAWLLHIFRQISDHHIWSRRPNNIITEVAALENYEATLRSVLDNDPVENKKATKATKTMKAYLDDILPRLLQEEIFHYGVHMCKKEEVLFDMFPLFFKQFWRPDFKHLYLPLVQSSSERLSVLEHLLAQCESHPDDNDDGLEPEEAGSADTTSVKFRLMDAKQSKLSMEESYLTKRIWRTMKHLKVLVLWKVCDNAMLSILGSTCANLEALDIWRSTEVTDLGIRFLLGLGLDHDNHFNDEAGHSNSLNPLCQKLVRVVVKETSCTHLGSLLILVHCPNLEILDLNHGEVVKNFLRGVCDIHMATERTFTLKSLFLPITHGGYEFLHNVVSAFPYLEDLRLWTTLTNITGINKEEFPNLHSLMLAGMHSNGMLKNLITTFGDRLTTLKIETVLTTVPLQVVGEHCPNLVELQVINARLAVKDHVCQINHGDNGFFSKLKLVHLFLVRYKENADAASPNRNNNTLNDLNINETNDSNNTTDIKEEARVKRPPVTALHCILNHAANLEAIQASGASSFTDDSLLRILESNGLKNLKRFILTDALAENNTLDLGGGGNNQNNLRTAAALASAVTPEMTTRTVNSRPSLSAKSVLRLFASCPHLQCLGDLRHWAISPEDRRDMFRQININHGGRWLLNQDHQQQSNAI